MDLVFWSLVAGVVGTVFMDIADQVMDRLALTKGYACGGPRAIGRWALGMLRGQFVHKDILASKPLKNEISAGWVVHYLLGAGVALTYPFFYLVLNAPMSGNHLVPGLLWGLATVILPWLTNFPAYGWGFFGIRSPKGSRPILAPVIAHTCYGLGVGLVFTLTVGGYS